MNVSSLTETTSCEELQENKKMEGDVLTAEMVSSNLTQPGSFCVKLQHIYHYLSLPSHNLSDISVLCNYIHLQKLELPHNKIKDLSSLSHMSYLVILDVSHNEICDFFEFQSLQYLQEVNFSHNRMTTMKDLSAYVSLRKLDLDYNSFCEISGLEQCCRLTHLSVAHNKITKISGLDSLPLTHLCLKGNQIETTEGLENVKNLQILDLSLNRITSLSGLQNLHLLGSINLEKNQITEIQELRYIHNLLLLEDLNLQENPVQEEPEYRLAVIFGVQHLTVLDQVKVSAEEKVTSVNMYDPPLDLVAARDHMTQLVYQLMQPQVLYDSTPPSSDSPYPVLVLSGPEGCGKKVLVHRLCQEFSEYLGYGICHTTRETYFGEENGIDYHFVSEDDFQNMIYMGKFIQTVQYGGHQFGLTRDAIEAVAKEGLACCVHVELEGVFSLKKSYFEPQYILLLPTQLEKYINHLKSRELYTPAQIDVAASRVELYANTNKQRPGFFNYVIPCDDLEEAYQTLRQVVKVYLSLEEEEEEEKNNRGMYPVCTFTGLSGHNPVEKPTSPQSGIGSGTPVSLSDPLGSTYRPYVIQADPNSHITPAELASIRKREQLVREAIVGKRPGVLSQLFKSFSPTSSSTHDKVPSTLFHEDSSSDECCASSALSVPSSAGALEKPLDSSVLVHRLDALTDHMASDIISNSPHPGTNELPAVGSPSSDSRPGSEAKIVLPPISAGHKTPATSTSTPSPTLSPILADEETGSANMKD
ncbi:leucine-rich repeat and guanylate kinase domain-containing protein isoform X2 [Kryptolebias marmoratus]|uniref:leucine-rich repeat and guanylate kinase domain-containing protein isoform X2 n=1 Tax=Kryptolebias marmoratus TaxID=37003 RepID=UPI000D52FABC|nr:leucine-rich repeat and guanylate kinase domain-containing protein isoform X2 [Kryptolebias marmoratus]